MGGIRAPRSNLNGRKVVEVAKLVSGVTLLGKDDLASHKIDSHETNALKVPIAHAEREPYDIAIGLDRTCKNIAVTGEVTRKGTRNHPDAKHKIDLVGLDSLKLGLDKVPRCHTARTILLNGANTCKGLGINHDANGVALKGGVHMTAEEKLGVGVVKRGKSKSGVGRTVSDHIEKTRQSKKGAATPYGLDPHVETTQPRTPLKCKKDC